MHRKISAIIIAIIMLLSLVACSKPDKTLTNIQNKESDDSILFVPYDPSGENPIEIPPNFIDLKKDNIYAVVDDNKEIIGYKKLVVGNSGYMFVDCDSDGNIIDEPETPLSLEKVSFSKEEADIAVGETLVLSYSLQPSNYEPQNIQWESSNEEVASVENGKITTIKNGECTITLTIDGKSTSCQIRVSDATTTTTTTSKPTAKPTTKPTAKPTTRPTTIVPSGIKLSHKTATIRIGETLQLTATVTPNNAKDKSVNWKSSNTSVATVSNGKITAKAAGTATITATTHNGKKATCTITVTKIPTTSIVLNKTSLTLYIGDSETLSATIQPSNATDKNVTWTSSDTSVVTVSNGSLKALKVGRATITAKTSGGQTAQCIVDVEEKKTVSISFSIQEIYGIPSEIMKHFVKYTETDTLQRSIISKDGYTYVYAQKGGGTNVWISSVRLVGKELVIDVTEGGNRKFVIVKFKTVEYDKISFV